MQDLKNEIFLKKCMATIAGKMCKYFFYLNVYKY